MQLSVILTLWGYAPLWVVQDNHSRESEDHVHLLLIYLEKGINS